MHIADRHHVEIAPGLNVQVLTRGGVAADDVDVLPRHHAQVAAGRDRGRLVFHVGGDGGFVPAVAEGVDLAGVADGDQVEVAPGFQVGIAAGGECTVVGEVAASVDGQVFAGGDGAGAAVGEGAHAGTLAHLDGGVVVGDVALQGGEADLGAAYLASHGIADAVLGQQAEVVAGLDQAAGVEAAAAGH